MGIMSEKENQIVVYQPNETVRLDVRLENETVWLTQLKIAELFGVQKAAISKHIKNIFASGELIRESTVSKMETVQIEGVFYDEQLWDARALVLKLILGAKKSLVLIDNWATVETLICLRRAVKVCLAAATARKAA